MSPGISTHPPGPPLTANLRTWVLGAWARARALRTPKSSAGVLDSGGRNPAKMSRASGPERQIPRHSEKCLSENLGKWASGPWIAIRPSNPASRSTQFRESYPQSKLAVAHKNGTQNGTLVSGNMDQNLRNPSCFILSHAQLSTPCMEALRVLFSFQGPRGLGSLQWEFWDALAALKSELPLFRATALKSQEIWPSDS